MYVIVLIIKTDMSIIPLSVCYSFHVRSPGCLHSGAVWTERDLSAVRVRSGRTLLSAETQHTGYVRGAVYVAMCHMCAVTVYVAMCHVCAVTVYVSMCHMCAVMPCRYVVVALRLFAV